MDWDALIVLFGLEPSDVGTVATAIVACGAVAMVLVQGLKGLLLRLWHVDLSATWAQVLAFVVSVALAAPTLVTYRASPLLIVLGVVSAAITGPLWHDLLRTLRPASSTSRA